MATAGRRDNVKNGVDIPPAVGLWFTCYRPRFFRASIAAVVQLRQENKKVTTTNPNQLAATLYDIGTRHDQDIYALLLRTAVQIDRNCRFARAIECFRVGVWVRLSCFFCICFQFYRRETTSFHDPQYPRFSQNCNGTMVEALPP
jgi:hypothetical protein